MKGFLLLFSIELQSSDTYAVKTPDLCFHRCIILGGV